MTSPESEYLRIFDANLNRIGEGLRFLEDLASLTLNDVGLTRQLKTIRHGIPVVAAGGITVENAAEAVAAGANAVAVIEAVLQADSPEEAAREIIERLERGKIDG